MKELLYILQVLLVDDIIKCNIKTNDDTEFNDVYDIDLDNNDYVRIYNNDYGLSLVYINNIKDIHVVKI